MSTLARVAVDATVDLEFVLDGYVTGAAPTLALTLPDGSAFSASMAAIAGPVVIDAIGDDRQTLTLADSIADSDVTRARGMVAILADGQIVEGILDDVDGTTATLSAPLPSGVTPESMVWLLHRVEVGPTFGAGDGPTAADGRLDGTITYSRVAPGTAETETHTIEVALDVTPRRFRTGLTAALLLRELGALSDFQGGLARLSRGPGMQPIIESTLDELRDHVAAALRKRSYSLGDVVGAGDFFAPHVLLVRGELIDDPIQSDRLRARAFASADIKVQNMQLDTDEDGVVDATVNAGVGLPSNLGAGFTTARTFNRDTIL